MNIMLLHFDEKPVKLLHFIDAVFVLLRSIRIILRHDYLLLNGLATLVNDVVHGGRVDVVVNRGWVQLL